MVVALIGNQNCGKTTLFNQLTGSNQHVGNFPGVTVDKKEGGVRGQKDVTVVDLPGIYSLSPYTAEEVVTRDFLLNEKPDCILNIVDATNIERNLYLTLQLTEVNRPMVVALNMMDEVRASGGTIDVKALSEHLGMPVVPISASKNEGVSELIDKVVAAGRSGEKLQRFDYCAGAVHKAIHSIAHIIEDKAEALGIPPRFAATKLVEGDEPMAKALSLTENERDIVGHVTDDMEKALGTDREAALADMRYEYIEKICAETVKKPSETKEQQRSVKIDRVLTHKYFAIPIFLAVMLFVFWMTFGAVGAFLSGILENGIDIFTDYANTALVRFGTSDAVRSLVIDGVFTGVGSVLSFLPTIVVLFFFLSLLEDSGYMARVAFVMDRLLRKIGLSGRSFVPILIGFGCSVPAVMATRTLSSSRDRRMTIMLIPFISCSAKLPIYAVFTQIFFEKYRALVLLAIYVLGIVLGILAGLLLKATVFKGKPVPFVMELPAYRLPSAKSVTLHMWEKAKDFISKAFTVIFAATIVIWFLQNFDFRLNMVTDSAESMLAALGRVVTVIFRPLGFADWRAATALITGLMAKEAVVSTFEILLGATTHETLSAVFPNIASVCSFLTFTLLYMPCVAALAAVKREMGGIKNAALAMTWQTFVAWLAAFAVYHIALLFV